MAIETKDPAKPGYMSTEFMAMVAYAGYALLGKVGLSSENVDEMVSSFPQIINEYLGGNPIATVVLGAVILYYTKSRTSIKIAKLNAGAIQKGDKENEV